MSETTPIAEFRSGEIEEDLAPEPEPMKISPLTGLEVTPGLESRPVTGLMIENSPEARPQSGLLEAGIVYEGLSEGGVTRFLALYQEATPDFIGPIRSARPAYVRWVSAYDASYGHVGGSNAALDLIPSLVSRDIDEFFNGSYYTRISERSSPHNVYTGFDRLDELNEARGYASSDYEGWQRKAEDPSSNPTATTISPTISNLANYNPTFVYNSQSNSYDRSIQGVPQTDLRSGNQISPKVVVAMQIPGSNFSASDGTPRHDYDNVGSGRAWIFQDGNVVQATWSKSSASAPLRLLDSADEPLSLNAGQTWLTAVSGVTWQ